MDPDLPEKLKKINLGLIGFSSGNGHPYSWPAIINGYNRSAMAQCPFPAIPNYLAREKWPNAKISNAEVTHIWTQDYSTSDAVAEASLIEHVCHDPSDMIGKIDGLLLARDDAENHFDQCKQFLEAYIPVYIDKPIALSLKELSRIRSQQKFDNQIFSCSALKFANELVFSADELREAGKIREIFCRVPKSWNKYIIHGLDPLFAQFPYLEPVKIIPIVDKTLSQAVSVLFKEGLIGHFTATNLDNTPIVIGIKGSNKTIVKTFSDAFSSFRAALNAFINSLRSGESMMDWDNTRAMIKIIDEGNKLCQR